MNLRRPIANFFFRIYVRWMELFGWGYWAYYPATDRLIWTRKQCQIYGMLCEKSVCVDGYEMFNRVVLDDGFRERARHAVEMSQKTHADFRQQFPARNQVTQEIIFVEARGEWVFDKHGAPYCLHGFNRRIDFGGKEFQQKLDQLNICRIIGEWKRDGHIPESILRNGTTRG